MEELVDNSEVNEVMSVLEEMDDEQLAVKLLAEFNAKTKELGELLLNKDPSLDHAHWKTLCDDAKRDVDEIVKKIKSYK